MGLKDLFISENQWGLPSDHLEGLDGIGYKDYISFVTEEKKQCIVIKLKSTGGEAILPFKQIVSVNFVTWEKTITKALNPLAEGIVGGLIGGNTMAVVSAIDAKGRTRSEKVKVEGALEIRYHPKEDFRTVKCIIIDPGRPRSMGEKWAKTLCRCANLPAPQYITPQPKGPTYL